MITLTLAVTGASLMVLADNGRLYLETSRTSAPMTELSGLRCGDRVAVRGYAYGATLLDSPPVAPMEGGGPYTLRLSMRLTSAETARLAKRYAAQFWEGGQEAGALAKVILSVTLELGE